MFPLLDQSMPAVGLQVSDGRSGDRNRADTAFRMDTSMARVTMNGDFDGIVPGRTNTNLFWLAAIKVET